MFKGYISICKLNFQLIGWGIYKRNIICKLSLSLSKAYWLYEQLVSIIFLVKRISWSTSSQFYSRDIFGLKFELQLTLHSQRLSNSQRLRRSQLFTVQAWVEVNSLAVKACCKGQSHHKGDLVSSMVCISPYNLNHAIYQNRLTKIWVKT